MFIVTQEYNQALRCNIAVIKFDSNSQLNYESVIKK